MKQRVWRVAPPQPQARLELEGGGVTPLLAAVLSARGIGDLEQANTMLSPRQQPLADPMLMRDMDRAVARIHQAIQAKELVAVYGDYDVDGITATCLIKEFLTDRGVCVIPYIPARLEEGYGLNREAVTALAGQGVKLLITVDCGITAVDEVEYANQLGLDVIITDHHACKEQLPPAVAVVDPHRSDCPYPFQGLAGVGVALKLAMAVAGPEGEQAVLARYCDLAAVGTVADVMPMTGENRVIVSLGLAQLNPAHRLGFAQLIAACCQEEKLVTSVFVGYTLAPRINASGRLGRAMVAVELLLTQDQTQAQQLAQELCSLNRERQAIEADIFQQCVQRLEQAPQPGAIVLADESWHQGVVGIVASRLAERYSCPTFMVCLSDGVGKGSCRSWGGVNLFALLSQCAHLLDSFGGHALAAGFTVQEQNIPALAQALRQCLELGEQPGDCTALEVDALVQPQELTVEAVESLDQLEPWGTGNPRPVLMLCAARVQALSQVGRGRHLKLRLESKGQMLDAIYFSADAQELGICLGCRVDVAFYPQINEFRGRRDIQLQVADLRLAPSRAQMEQAVYEKYHQGQALTAQEAGFLLPSRTDFVALWRWLERQSAAGAVVEDTIARIAKCVSRTGGEREAPVRTQMCLEVMEERGLISVHKRPDRIQITLHRLEEKVDLEASEILCRLRQALDG